MFDATLQALNVEIVEAEDHVQLVIVIGLVLPVGPNQAVPVPAGVVRVPMSKDAAKTRGQELVNAADNLPDAPKPSSLVIANNLNGVDQAVESVNKFTKRA